MFGSLPQPAHTPCPDCGASVPREAEHICDAGRETDLFDTELTSWLASPSGRFAVYYAERERLRAA